MNDDNQLSDRRPLNSRDTQWAQRLAKYLAGTSITPNQISYASVGFAVVAALAFIASSHAQGWPYAASMVFVLLGCQLRLICNLMDGMVAIEAGKQTRDGALWNEFPDRIADVVIIAALGFATGWLALGWVGAALAVLVAYTRELGKGIDGVVDFAGPMAKPQRMALISGGALLAAFAELTPIASLTEGAASLVLLTVLIALVIGCVATVVRRVMSMQRRLSQ